MAGFKCPFCGHYMSISETTYAERKLNFDSPCINTTVSYPHLLVKIYRCPNENCKEESIILEGIGGYIGGQIISVYPESCAVHFPEYIVPQAIRADYEEAYSIVSKSPKSAAALARRCLQGMIRDFWKITGKRNLRQEIDAIKDKVPFSQWQAIDAIRSIGNIGAHMEKDVNHIIDVEPYEAKQLLSLIELLIDKWYVARYDEEKLYAELCGIAENKENSRQV